MATVCKGSMLEVWAMQQGPLWRARGVHDRSCRRAFIESDLKGFVAGRSGQKQRCVVGAGRSIHTSTSCIVGRIPATGPGLAIRDVARPGRQVLSRDFATACQAWLAELAAFEIDSCDALQANFRACNLRVLRVRQHIVPIGGPDVRRSARATSDARKAGSSGTIAVYVHSRIWLIKRSKLRLRKV